MAHFDEPMDRAIDDVARAMTAAPAPALEAGVVARLRPRSSGRPAWLAPVAVALATASVALLVVTVRSRPAAVAPPAVTSSPALLTSAATRVPPPQAHGPEARRVAKRRVDATTQADLEATGWSDRAVPALEAVP